MFSRSSAGIYLLLFMGMSCVSIALTVLILTLHHMRSVLPPPPWLLTLTYDVLKPLLCWKRFPGVRPQPQGKGAEVPQKIQQLPRPEEESEVKEDLGPKIHSEKMQQLMLVAKFLQLMSERGEAKEAERAACAQWKRIAAILDRFFFWLFLFLMIVCSVVVLFGLSLTKSSRKNN